MRGGVSRVVTVVTLFFILAILLVLVGVTRRKNSNNLLLFLHRVCKIPLKKNKRRNEKKVAREKAARPTNCD